MGSQTRSLVSLGLSVFFLQFATPLSLAKENLRISSAGVRVPELPVFFEKNEGQFRPPVRFAARSAGYSLFLKKGGATLYVPAGSSKAHSTIDVSFVRANTAAEVAGIDPLQSRSSYFLGRSKSNWRPGVAQYTKVRYRSLYPGVDLLWHLSSNQLEYDFILRPGADPNRILLKFCGVRRLTVSNDGNLILESVSGQVIQKKPEIYQGDGSSGRCRINGRYRLLSENLVGFSVGPYDRSRELVIDPVLVYSSLIGAASTDIVKGIQVDSSGMIYVVGSMSQTDLAGTDGAYRTTSAGNADIFVAKFNPALSGRDSLVYLTYIGGASVDTPTSMALDASGNVWITGSTNSTDFPVVGAYQSTLSGGTSYDAFVCKLRPAAQGATDLAYSTYLGGGDLDVGNGIAVDSAGMVYVAGTTRSGNFPVTSSPYQSVRWGDQDAFIAKLDPSSTLLYSSYLGGETSDEGRSVAVAPNGLVYFAGSTLSTTFPLAGNSYRGASGGKIDVFLAVMDMTKDGFDSLVYATYFGGSDVEELRKIALDKQGRVWMTGYTMSADLPVSPNAFQSALSGVSDAFVACFDLRSEAPSALSFSSFLGGADGEVGYDVTLDSSNRAYVTGYTLSSDFPITADAVQSQYGGGVDVFVAEVSLGDSSPASLAFSSYLGQSGVHVGYGIAVASDGKLYIGGSTSGENVPITSNSAQNTYGGGSSDGFVMVLAPSPEQNVASSSATRQ